MTNQSCDMKTVPCALWNVEQVRMDGIANYYAVIVVLETKVLVSRRVEDKNESFGLGLGLGSWSLSLGLEHFGLGLGLGEKVLAVFQDFCCNSWRQWARHIMASYERQQKQFAILKPSFERTFCVPCTSTPVERVFSHGGFLLGHTERRCPTNFFVILPLPNVIP